MKDIGTKTIKTERLKLRKFEEKDVKEVYENYGSDEKITRYISWIACDSIEKCEKFIEFNKINYENNPQFYSWAITFNDTIIGSIAIFNVEDNHSGELGYSIGSKWWSRGFMTEACDAILDYAFNQAEFHRIYATCHEDNLASKRVLEKLKMTYEGKLRDGQKNLDGSYSNLDLYSILEVEYKNRMNRNHINS